MKKPGEIVRLIQEPTETTERFSFKPRPQPKEKTTKDVQSESPLKSTNGDKSKK